MMILVEKNVFWYLNRFLNTTNNPSLFYIVLIICSLMALFIITFFLIKFINSICIDSHRNIDFLNLFISIVISLIQIIYFCIGVCDCYTDTHFKHIKLTPGWYAQSHDLLYLTLLYIIINFLLYYFLSYHLRNKEPSINDAIEITGVIIAVITIAVSSHISAVNCICIIVFVIFSVQFELFHCFINDIKDKRDKKDNKNNNELEIVILEIIIIIIIAIILMLYELILLPL